MSRPLDDVRLAVLMLDGDRAEGPLLRRRAGDHDRRRQDPARAVGRLDGEQDRRRAPARQTSSTAAWMSSRACWSSSTAPRRCAPRSDDVFGPVPVQRCIRHKERNVLDHLPERDRPAVKATAAPRVGQRRPRARARPAPRCSPPSSTARIPAPPRRCARASRRRSPSPACGIRGRLEAHAGAHEPDRVDDRDRPAHQPQRQALAVRRHVPALDRRRDARSRAASSAGHRLQRPRQARHRRRARPRRPDATPALTPPTTEEAATLATA